MSQATSFWRRLGDLFRGGIGERWSGNGHNRVNGTALEDRTADQVVPPERDGSPNGTSPRSLARWGRREPTVTQLRDGYQRVLEMMDALQEHFRQQDARAERLGRSAERTAGTLEQLAGSQQAQQEHLRLIAEQVSEAGKHAVAMSASLGQMPRMLQLQADALKMMLRQFEVSQEADTQLMHSLQHLGRAVDTLSASSTTQVQTLERLALAERAQHEALTLLVREQSRRFLIIIVVAAILSLGALAALALVVALQLAT